MNTKKPAIFLDRDGVIIEEKHYISKPEDVVLTHLAADAIRLFSINGYYSVVVTNQAGIAKGYFTLQDYYNVTNRMEELLKEQNAVLDLILYSPYHIEGTVLEYKKQSKCRKPDTGMFLDAIDKLSIDISNSWMIGDKTSDIEAGKNMGLKTILVKTGYGKSEIPPDYICDNLYEASKLIISVFPEVK